MKKKSKIAIGILVMTFCIGGFIYATKERPYFEWGKQLAGEEKAFNSTKVIAKVNGIDISEEEFEKTKLAHSVVRTDASDDDIMKVLIRQKVIASEAKKRGITVTEQEVKEFNDQRFDGMMQDPKMKQAMEDFLEGKQQTLEEYKEQSLAVSEAALIAMKLQEQLIKENQVKPEEVTKFLNDTVETLIENAVIERFDE
ncbi:MAG: SurA N-terminal domain-containing protein [Bacillota bacterium]|nr:SurA N-terminal domain-containing protein [Bacillota bacterium]